MCDKGIRISIDVDDDENSTNVHMTDQNDNEHLNLPDTTLDEFIDEWGGGKNTDISVKDNEDGTTHVTIYTINSNED